MSAQARLNRLWYGSRAPAALVPAEWLYGAVGALRRAGYRRGWLGSRRVARPVVVVGNLTVGGVGKTPLVAWLAARLTAAGRRPGIASRGYRGTSHGVRLVAPEDPAALVGDEPLLLARRRVAPVAVGRERAAAADLLIAAGCDVIVCDDGLQHYALARDVEIAVVDGERRLGNGHLLPAGPLREPARRLREVDAVVVNGGVAGAGELAMRLLPGEAVRIRDGARAPLAAFAGGPVHAVAGIGNPARYFRMLRDAGLDPIEHPLDDHARAGAGSLAFGDHKPVLMTEKDAVKCADLADERYWYVPVDAGFDAADEATLLGVVLRSI